MKVLIAAAGTAGHINPGLAIANKIKEKNKGAKIVFIGTTRGLENDLVPRAGYELKTIEAYGLSKKISIDTLQKNIKTLKGFIQAGKIVKEFEPDIVIGTGGYICGAVISAAKKNNIPTLLHESNAFPGKAVKLLAPKTDTILISFEDARNRIKRAKNIVFTGTPVKIKKREYTNIEKEKILKELGLNNDKKIILIFGGSQGAKKINEAIVELLKNKQNDSYQIIWATGPKQYDIVKAEFEKNSISMNNIKNAKILPYIYNMEEAMNIADVIIARSGAMTITEISNLGKPSILIPLPNVSQDHQLFNAKVLEKIEAAKIILNDDLNNNNLNESIHKIIDSEDILMKMSKNATKVSTQNVEEKIYKEIERLIELRRERNV